MPTEKHRLSVTFPNGMFDEIVKYQEANSLRSQSSAIIELLHLGIAELDNSPSESLSDLIPSETQLLALHRQLNEEGQEKLLSYADDLVSSGKYIKSDPLGLVAK